MLFSGRNINASCLYYFENLRVLKTSEKMLTYSSSQQLSGQVIRFPEERKFISSAGAVIPGYGKPPGKEQMCGGAKPTMPEAPSGFNYVICKKHKVQGCNT